MVRVTTELELPINQIRVLGRLAMGEATMAEVAQVLQLGKSSATLVINEMGADGLIVDARALCPTGTASMPRGSAGGW